LSDITVVGAGFVGLSFALAAGRQGFTVEVFDRKSRPEATDQLSSNVLAINPASQDFLDSEGVWQEIEPEFRAPYDSMSVVDGNGTGVIHFSASESGLAQLGYVVDQTALLGALVARSDDCENVSVHWQSDADVAPGRSSLLVGADGAHSQIREKLGLRKIGFSYDQTATVCLAETAEPHGQCARQWFLEKGPLAMLPLSDPHRVAVVWSCFDSLAELEDEAFLSSLYEASEGEMGEIREVGPRSGFPLRQQHALQYVTEGVALMGDAAHAIHPLAGQGANLGFADGRTLVAELIAGRVEGRSPGSLGVLKRYQKKRMRENYLTAFAMEGFHRLFTSNELIVGVLRSQGLRFFDSSARLKQIMIGAASG
jgi:2-polyprenylphenol 6-hydroxylase